MKFSTLLDKIFPPRKLTLSLKYPEEKMLTLTRNRRGEIELNDSPDQLFTLKQIILRLSEYDKQAISNGAVAGAFVAAARGKDVLRGAIIGDWWEKQKDTKSRRVEIQFENMTSKEIRVVSLKLNRKQYAVVKKFLHVA